MKDEKELLSWAGEREGIKSRPKITKDAGALGLFGVKDAGVTMAEN